MANSASCNENDGQNSQISEYDEYGGNPITKFGKRHAACGVVLLALFIGGFYGLFLVSSPILNRCSAKVVEMLKKNNDKRTAGNQMKDGNQKKINDKLKSNENYENTGSWTNTEEEWPTEISNWSVGEYDADKKMAPARAKKAAKIQADLRASYPQPHYYHTSTSQTTMTTTAAGPKVCCGVSELFVGTGCVVMGWLLSGLSDLTGCPDPFRCACCDNTIFGPRRIGSGPRGNHMRFLDPDDDFVGVGAGVYSGAMGYHGNGIFLGSGEKPREPGAIAVGAIAGLFGIGFAVAGCCELCCPNYGKAPQ